VAGIDNVHNEDEEVPEEGDHVERQKRRMRRMGR